MRVYLCGALWCFLVLTTTDCNEFSVAYPRYFQQVIHIFSSRLAAKPQFLWLACYKIAAGSPLSRLRGLHWYTNSM